MSETHGILELADAIWDGRVDIAEHHPLFVVGDLVEVAPDVAFLPSFANVSLFSTSDGLLAIDTSGPMFTDHVMQQLRSWSQEGIAAVVYTHGHIDHVSGTARLDAEADETGRDRPRVYAHEDVSARFDRYKMTAGYNGVINARQFQVPGLEWPTEYRYPDETFQDELEITVGSETFRLHHARGETDDHTWLWAPERKVLCCGDLFIWSCPNAGNPQKVQRYPMEWAKAAREMASLDAEMMLPGHGWPVVGAARVREVLTGSAELLESIVEQTLDLINRGIPLDEVLQRVQPPEHLLSRPYLRPIYDEPEFIVRNVWRLYAGWYDGDPAHLKPAPSSDIAREIAELAGGATKIARRALELAERGDLRLATNLVEIAGHAAPEDPEVLEIRARIYARRADEEASTMAKGIFRSAAERGRP